MQLFLKRRNLILIFIYYYIFKTKVRAGAIQVQFFQFQISKLERSRWRQNKFKNSIIPSGRSSNDQKSYKEMKKYIYGEVGSGAIFSSGFPDFWYQFQSILLWFNGIFFFVFDFFKMWLFYYLFIYFIVFGICRDHDME